jgi:ATP-dependent DNA helicase RecG
VSALRGVGSRYTSVLDRLGVFSVADLLRLYPRRHQSRDQVIPLRQALHGQPCTLLVKVRSVDTRRSKAGLMVTSVMLEDDSGVGKMVFFNQRFLQTTFEKLRNHEILVYGVADRNKWDLCLRAPEWEEAGDETDTGARIQPVYPLTQGLSQKLLRKLTLAALPPVAPLLPDPLPEPVRRERRLPSLREALWGIHYPESRAVLDAAHKRLVYEEFFVLQAALARRRRAERLLVGQPFLAGEEQVARLEASLPFQLTGAQHRVLRQLLEDMSGSRPMSRLLQGDVGSGKTLVAAGALMVAIANGTQGVLMAPTEILAEQHFRGLHRLLTPLGISVGMLTGSLPLGERARIYELSANGKLDLVVGTHALIQERLEFARLGLAVVDEQHRFGVEQRASLRAKGANPHLLVMTATPIPRSLALTVYGDLDLSILDEMPPGRKPVITHLKPLRDRAKVYEAVRSLLQQGHQVYVICPLVEESEKLQSQAATALAEELSRKVYPEYRVALLHGQLNAAEKDAALDAFHRGEARVLVSTTVVEVGVDVPEASVMVIENAERFGLAQLHQLRGRVGRGERQSYCVLLSDPSTEEGRQRLEVLATTQDGFRIAEEDLRIRGPGEFAGTRQAGIPAFRIANVLTDLPLLQEARDDALAWVERDPELSLPESTALRQEVLRVEASVKSE